MLHYLERAASAPKPLYICIIPGVSYLFYRGRSDRFGPCPQKHCSIAASLHGHAPSLPHSTIFPRLILSIQEGRRWQMVCQGPRPGFVLCSRDGKICCYGDALSTIFLLTWYLILCLDSYFSFFFSFPFLFLSASCPFVCAAATCYSQQVRILFMIRVLSACVICTLPRLGFLHRFLP